VVINRHKCAAHIESPDGGTGKTPLAEVCTVPVLLLYGFEFGLLLATTNRLRRALVLFCDCDPPVTLTFKLD